MVKSDNTSFRCVSLISVLFITPILYFIKTLFGIILGGIGILFTCFQGDSSYQYIKFTENMSGRDFEKFLKKLYEKMGYSVDLLSYSSDQGGDLLLEKEGTKTLIQAKRSSSKVSNKAIQEVVAAIRYYRCDKGAVITNNFFTKSAEELAKSNSIELIDRKKLGKYIQNYLPRDYTESELINTQEFPDEIESFKKNMKWFEDTGKFLDSYNKNNTNKRND